TPHRVPGLVPIKCREPSEFCESVQNLAVARTKAAKNRKPSPHGAEVRPAPLCGFSSLTAFPPLVAAPASRLHAQPFYAEESQLPQLRLAANHFHLKYAKLV